MLPAVMLGIENCDTEQEKHHFWYHIFVSSTSIVYLFFFCTVQVISSIWIPQNNLTGANILGCTAQYKTFTSYSLYVLVREEVTKYLPRDTDVPAGVTETVVRQRCMYNTDFGSCTSYGAPAEILPLTDTAPAKPSNASPKPLFI